VVPVIGDDRDCFAVVPSKHSNHWRVPLGLKGNAITNTEFEHLGVRAHMIEKAKALDDSIVQID